MNLFFLHHRPDICAEYHCDKHVVKMIIEIVQMLYTAHLLLCSQNLPKDHYRKISTHMHPTAIWIRKRKENYLYAAELACSIAYEYTRRYNRIHSCEKHALWLKQNLPCFNNLCEKYKESVVFAFNKNLEAKGMTPVPLCMPSDCYLSDPIESYRKYYKMYKAYFVRWKTRDVPSWFSFGDIRKYF